MSTTRPGSSSGIYSHVTTAFASRIPVFNTVVRRRTNPATDDSRPQTPQPRTRSSSSLSTNSLDSTATTAVASGTTTPCIVPESLSISRVDVAPNNSNTQTTPVKEQGSLSTGNVDRDTARAGVILATAALNRLDNDIADTSARAMYIDAVKYMTRSLPEDLSDSEKSTLDITTALTSQTASHDQQLCTTTTTFQQRRTAKIIRTTSSRIVNILLSTLFSLLLLGIPVFALLCTRALEYERRYRLSEKAVEGTRNLASSAGTTLVKASKSRSGAYCLATVLCVVQSILEGASEGIDKSSVEFGTRLPA